MASNVSYQHGGAAGAPIAGVSIAGSTTSTTYVSSSLPISWTLLAKVSSSLTLSYDIQERVSRNQTLSWDLRNNVSRALGISWNTLEAVSSTVTISWDLRQKVSSDLSVSWDLRKKIYSHKTFYWANDSDSVVSYQDYLNWLRELDALRCILVELRYSGGIKRASNLGFVDQSSTKPYEYPDTLIGVTEITQTIDGDHAIGGVEIYNNGELDDWIDLPWVGYEIIIKMGSPSWAYADFRTVITGVNMGISAPSHNTLAFTLQDKRELLRVPVQTSLMADDTPKPLAIGDPFNVEPALEDAPTLRYRYHENSAAVCSAGTVRDNGVSVSFTDQADGSFVLLASPAGRITCDPTGPTTNTPASVVEWLALRAPQISGADLDSANMAAYPTTPSVSLATNDSHYDILDLINEVMLSTGGAILFDRLGYLQMVRLQAPAAPVITLYADDVDEYGLNLEEVEQPVENLPLRHSKNWAVQDPDSLAGAVSPEDRELYSTEFKTVTGANTLGAEYLIPDEPEPVDTLIDNATDAQVEADRRAALRSTKRKVFSIEAAATPFQVKLGDTITVVHPRYGFENGQDCVVIGMTHRLSDNSMQLKVWL